MKSLSVLIFTVLAMFSVNSARAHDRHMHISAVTVPALAVTTAHGLLRANVVVVEQTTTYWIDSPAGKGRLTITLPKGFYLTSWDVKALEKELERLGVKHKPKPLPPKPISKKVISILSS